MQPIEFIAQAAGIVAMGLSIFSFQQKTKKRILTVQICSCALFCLNFLLLGATTGALLNAIGIVRAVVYVNKEKLKKEEFIFIGFIATYLAVYVLTFTAFGSEFNLRNALLELLPVVGMIASNVGFRLKDAAAFRRASLVSSPLWWIYDFIMGSIGGTLCETFNLASIITAIIRLDIKRTGAGTSQTELDGEIREHTGEEL